MSTLIQCARADLPRSTRPRRPAGHEARHLARAGTRRVHRGREVAHRDGERLDEQPRRTSAEVVGRGLPDAATPDLSHYSRMVQRALHQLTVAHLWTPQEIAPPYRPEKAGASVVRRKYDIL
jgi:hypothetical protein